MVQVIDQLRLDHRNMRLLLAIVEDEMRVWREGGVPDIDLLRTIAEYILHYPELVHHPKEDLVFERLLRRDPEAKEVIRDLFEDHRQLAKLSSRFAAAIGNATHDIQTRREKLAPLAREYLLTYRLHMQVEEEQFLPRAMAVLTDEDWAEIDKKVAHVNDPLFGMKVAEAFLSLHKRILKTREIESAIRQFLSD